MGREFLAGMIDAVKESIMSPSKLDQAFDFQTQSLKLRAYRSQLLASNIANADTPNYKAVDIDFQKELQQASTRIGDAFQMKVDDPRHIQGVSGSAYGTRVMYRDVVQPSIDGNTVNMDTERAQFTENALHYETTLRVMSSQMRTLMTAIKGQ